MYNSNDMQEARRSLNRCSGLLALMLAPLLALYVLGIIKGLEGLMLSALLIGFICTVLIVDLKLLPVLRYLRFLKEMEKGLRRKLECKLESLDVQMQMQDGVRVHALHVSADGGSRIFYVNASKMELLPKMGARVVLTSYGRHVLNCEVL